MTTFHVTAFHVTALNLFFGTIVLSIFSMAVYARHGVRRDADAEEKHAQFISGAGDFLLHWFMWVLQPATTWSIRKGLTPDFYNWVGLAFGTASAACFATGRLGLGAWALVLSGVADILDGRVARTTHATSLYGDFIDSAIDRFVEVFVFVAFVWYYRADAGLVVASVAALSSSLLVSYARARGESLGVNCTGGLMQRGERLLLIALACFFDPALSARIHRPGGTVLYWVLVLIAVTSFVTAIHRSIWISRRLRGVPEP